MHDPHLIQELKQAFSKGVRQGVINLDKFLTNRQAFTIFRLEELSGEKNLFVPPFRHSDFIIIYVRTAAGRRSIGHYTFDIVSNSIVVVPKHVIHTAAYTENPTGFLVAFNPDFFLRQSFPYKLLTSKRVLNPALKPFIALNEEQGNLITTLFETMMEECNSGFEEKKEMIALKLLELLILCDRYFTEKDNAEQTIDYSQTMQSFTELIDANFTKHRDVQFYADALHTHPNNLNHIVKKASGLTAKQTITNRLLIEAKYLLAATTMTVKEVAFELGFEDPNYFNSFFKKEQQISPAQYRTQLL